jgi:hypothetical protein
VLNRERGSAVTGLCFSRHMNIDELEQIVDRFHDEGPHDLTDPETRQTLILIGAKFTVFVARAMAACDAAEHRDTERRARQAALAAIRAERDALAALMRDSPST